MSESAIAEMAERVVVSVYTPDHTERVLVVKSLAGVGRCVRKMWLDYLLTTPDGQDAQERANQARKMTSFSAPDFRAYPLPPDGLEPQTDLYLTGAVDERMFAVGSAPYRFLLMADPERTMRVGVSHDFVGLVYG